MMVASTSCHGSVMTSPCLYGGCVGAVDLKSTQMAYVLTGVWPSSIVLDLKVMGQVDRSRSNGFGR